MLSIKRLLYSLKRRFGTHVDFYQEVEGTTDVLTGKKVVTRTKYSIPLAVFLDQTLETASPLNKILGQLTGVMETSTVKLFIDANDFIGTEECKCNYIPTTDDYVIIDHQRYEISEIFQVDNDQSYLLKLVEFKGSQLFEIFDV